MLRETRPRNFLFRFDRLRLIDFYCLLFTVSGVDAEDRARAMLLCPPSFLRRLAQSLPLFHCATPHDTSENDYHGLGFSGLSQLFSRLFFWVQLPSGARDNGRLCHPLAGHTAESVRSKEICAGESARRNASASKTFPGAAVPVTWISPARMRSAASTTIGAVTA